MLSIMFPIIRSILGSIPEITTLYTITGDLLYSLANPSSTKQKVLLLQAASLETCLEESPVRDGTVSIIHQSQHGPPIVANHTFEDDNRQSHVLPGATAYEFLPDPASPTINDKRLQKYLRKSITSAEKLYQLLRGDQIDNAHQRTHACNHDLSIEFPVVTIGENCFISRPPFLDSSDTTEVYTKTRFQYGNGVTETQYFQFRCAAIKSAPLLGRFKHIYINTGICLFSKPVISTSQSSLNPGTLVIPALPQDVNLTMYELEIITRLSSAVADTVGLIGKTHISCNTRNSINIDIPDLSYYWIACELLQQELVTASYVQSWIAAIDKRRSQLGRVITSLIRTFLKDRHLCDVLVNITSGTAPLTLLVKEKISVGSVPSLEELLIVLRSEGKDASLWSEFLDNLDPRHRPLTMRDLSRLVYVFKAVKPALLDQSPQSSSLNLDALGSKLIILVDDVKEWRIFDRAMMFLKQYSKQRYGSSEEPVFIGLCPMQRIFVAGTARSNLYDKDPGSRFCSESGRMVLSPMDVIGTTYGGHVKEQLQLLCGQAGFM